jgi:DNA repair exonuclease SbcCD ATPase subunit
MKMETQYDYMKLPEYKEGQAAYQQVRQACEKVKELVDGNVGFVVNAAIRLQKELEVAQKVSDAAQSKLIAEEMKNAPTPGTVEKTRAAAAEVVRLNETLSAVSRSGGLALIKLQEKVDRLRIKIYEAESLKRGVKDSFPGFDLASIKKSSQKEPRLKEIDRDIEAMKSELQTLEKSISILKENQKKFGKLLSVDTDTAEAAQGVINTAAQTWSKREELRLKLVSKLEQRKKDMENLKQELFDLEQAISGLNPDYLGDVLFASKISMVVWPDLFENFNELGQAYSVDRRRSLDYIQQQCLIRLRRTARQLEQERGGTV